MVYYKTSFRYIFILTVIFGIIFILNPSAVILYKIPISLAFFTLILGLILSLFLKKYVDKTFSFLGRKINENENERAFVIIIIILFVITMILVFYFNQSLLN